MRLNKEIYEKVLNTKKKNFRIDSWIKAALFWDSNVIDMICIKLRGLVKFGNACYYDYSHQKTENHHPVACKEETNQPM